MSREAPSIRGKYGRRDGDAVCKVRFAGSYNPTAIAFEAAADSTVANGSEVRLQIAPCGDNFMGENPVNPSAGAGSALRFDTSQVIRELAGVEEAMALPAGSVVGDPYGGLTFSDAIAAALECRSSIGWQDIVIPSGEVWTVIVLDRGGSDVP